MIKDCDYNLPFPVEGLNDYEDGGLPAIHIHDRFHDGRYEILNKLGVGGYSTVWAARDHHRKANVTIKAIRADCSESTKELRILQHIQKNAAQHPGRKHLPELLDHFYEGSSEKKNLFLVLELLGPMVRDVVGYLPGKRFSPSSASQLSRQLFLAIDCLHSQGIVHGDIYESNILFRLPDDYELDLSKVCRGNISRKDGAPLEKGLPRYLVNPLMFKHQQPRSNRDEWRLGDFRQIQLIDFSTSFFNSEPPESIHTVVHLSPPELIFQMPLSKSVDIWNLGCTIFYFSTGHALFETIWTNSDRRKFIPLIHRSIGESSAQWLLTAVIDVIQDSKWTDISNFRFEHYDGWSIFEDDLQKYYNIGQSSSDKALIKFIRKCLVADPSKRATTADLEVEEWIQMIDN